MFPLKTIPSMGSVGEGPGGCSCPGRRKSPLSRVSRDPARRLEEENAIPLRASPQDPLRKPLFFPGPFRCHFPLPRRGSFGHLDVHPDLLIPKFLSVEDGHSFSLEDENLSGAGPGGNPQLHRARERRSFDLDSRDRVPQGDGNFTKEIVSQCG